MNNWYTGTYTAFLIVSIISFIIYMLSVGQTSLGAYISGLCSLILGLIMILYIVIYNILNTIQNSSLLKGLTLIINISLPFLIMLGVTLLILYLLITNKERIIRGRISNSFYTFSNISVLILLIQMIIVYNNINSSKFDSTKRLSRLTSIILNLFNVITGLCAITLFNILKYYSADG